MENSNIFDGGVPVIRSWVLFDNGYLPLTLCTFYVVGVKYVGPFIMKDRKPFDLRLLMVIYNFAIVLTYSILLFAAVSILLQPEYSTLLCKNFSVSEDPQMYTLLYVVWIIYALKYFEFLDTVFFVLRKKDHLITNLHVIHHGSLPIVFWFIVRTEKNAFQGIPLIINSFVHVIMYTYYGMAAVGPSVRKYLWWKEYLTMLQMLQFVLILITISIVGPLLGCKITIFSIIIDVLFAILFFFLFFNYYKKTFLQRKPMKIEKKS